MGLDIEYFGRVDRLDPQPPRDDEESWLREDRVWVYCIEPDHLYSFRGLEKGWYSIDPTSGVGHFAAGSCTSYGEWRRRLCACALRVEPEEVWENPDLYRDEPFYEIIRFADNEGCIGPEAAVDLAQDFGENKLLVLRAYADAWGACDPEREWFRTMYDEFRKAFRTAAGTGLVRYC